MRLRDSFPTFLLDLIIPPRQTEHEVRSLSPEILAQITRPAGHADRAHVHLLPYRETQIRALIWEIKYHKNVRAVELAATLLCEEVLGIASEALSTPVIIPIPMHSARRKKRGFNQTESICAAIAKKTHDSVTYLPQALMRTRETAPQQGLARSARLKNVRYSMQVRDAAAIHGRICIVIDDVATTGATFKEARRALEDAGVEEIYCIALAG